MKRDPQPQPGSAKCFVCGTDNPHGLGATFFDDGVEVWTEVTPAEHHQSWPGVLHGGVVTAILDETIGRVAFLHDRWVQTAKLEMRFKKPAPLGEALTARGRLVLDKRRLMQMAGELVVSKTGEKAHSVSIAPAILAASTRSAPSPKNQTAARLAGSNA